MNKSSIKKELMGVTNGSIVITQNQVKKVMRWGNDRTIKTLKGLPFVRDQKTKQYLVDDVAAAIAGYIEQPVRQRDG